MIYELDRFRKFKFWNSKAELLTPINTTYLAKLELQPGLNVLHARTCMCDWARYQAIVIRNM